MAAYISFQPSDYFCTRIWTGDESSRTISTGFQTDFFWGKCRSHGGDYYEHQLIDSVRGVTKILESNSTNAELTEAGRLTAFTADGPTIDESEELNQNTKTYVGWNWKAGTTSGLSGGTITPSAYSISTTAGQSIIAYTGTGSAATLPHGLGATPDYIQVKRLDTTGAWLGYHKDLGGPNKYIILDRTGGVDTDTNVWNNTAPTSTVFSIGTDAACNGSGGTFIAYCYTNKKGYSKFGSYEGNGNADGTFVYTGFRPAFVMVKKTNGAEGWYMYDDKRAGYNADNNILFANSDSAEDTTDTVDLLSNGFKWRATGGAYNGSSGEYIYMAFAEFPFVSSNSKPGTAR